MQTAELRPAQHRTSQLRQFLLLSYGATLLNTFGYLRSASFAGVPAVLYTVAVYLSYSFAYLLPAAILIAAIDFIGIWKTVSTNSSMMR